MLQGFVGIEIVIIVTSSWWYKKIRLPMKCFLVQIPFMMQGQQEASKQWDQSGKGKGPEKVTTYRSYGKNQKPMFMSTAIKCVLKSRAWNGTKFIWEHSAHSTQTASLGSKSAHDPESKPPLPTRDALPNKLDPGDGHQSDVELKACRWSAQHSHPKYCKATGDSGTSNDRVALTFIWIMILLNP